MVSSCNPEFPKLWRYLQLRLVLEFRKESSVLATKAPMHSCLADSLVTHVVPTQESPVLAFMDFGARTY
jgi:hypothetical protein